MSSRCRKQGTSSNLDVDSIAKAVSGAVSSVLSKMNNDGRPHDRKVSSSEDEADFNEPVRKRKKTNSM